MNPAKREIDICYTWNVRTLDSMLFFMCGLHFMTRITFLSLYI
jgi:hypothetical protein